MLVCLLFVCLCVQPNLGGGGGEGNHYILSSSLLEPLDLSSCEDGIGALTVLAKPEHAMLHGACRVTETVSESTPCCMEHVGSLRQ